MNEIDKIQEEIIAEFDLFDDWMDKYEHIIEFAKDVPQIDESLKQDVNLVKGCQSKVWLAPEKKGDKLYFKADSDAVITRGIVGLLIRILSGQSPNDIAKADLYALDKIGLKEHLSPNRANGLVSMVNVMKSYAQATA